MSNQHPVTQADHKSGKSIGKKIAAWRLRIIRHPFSALLRLLTILSVAITVFLFLEVTISILIQGIPKPDVGPVLLYVHHG